jgi:oligosaccharide repeat unit polymerase
MLGYILIVHYLICNNWVTGQSAFTGIWFLSLTGLWGFPQAQNFISTKAALLIIFVHLTFFIGSAYVYMLGKGKISSYFKIPTPSPGLLKALSYYFFAVGFVGLLGSCLVVFSTGALGSFQEGELSLVRSMLGTQELQVPILQRLMSNFLYPASVLGAICFLFSMQSFSSWIYLLLPLIGLSLYGFGFGGRGAMILGTPMLFWVLFMGRKRFFTKTEGWKNCLLLMIVILVLVGFASLIVTTRSDQPHPLFSLYIYFIGPIPAFSAWLDTYDVLLLNFKIGNISIVREIIRLFGMPVNERLVGSDVVFIPFQFNVFTHLLEHLRDFGITGTLIISGILGMITSIFENKSLSVTVLGIRAILYGYLSLSLFTDLAFFIVGWWLTLLMIAVGIPLLRRLCRFQVNFSPIRGRSSRI